MCVLSRYEKYLLVRRCTTGETPGGLALHRGKENPLTSVREGRLDHRLGPISFAVLRGQAALFMERGKEGLSKASGENPAGVVLMRVVAADRGRDTGRMNW